MFGRVPAPQNVPTVFGNPDRRIRLELAAVWRRETLWRGSKNLLKLATEMGFVGKLQSIGSSFVGVSLGDEIFGQSALEFAEPMTGRAMQMPAKEPLQLPLGNGAQGSHLGGIKLGFSCHLLPLFDCQQASIHMRSL